MWTKLFKLNEYQVWEGRDVEGTPIYNVTKFYGEYQEFVNKPDTLSGYYQLGPLLTAKGL